MTREDAQVRFVPDSDAQLLERFAEDLVHDPELGRLIGPHPGRVLRVFNTIGLSSTVVRLLDRAAQLWAAVREEQPCQT